MRTLLIADDHPLYREAMKNTLLNEYSSLHIIESVNVKNTLELLDGASVSLLLLDLYMPDSTDLHGFLRIQKEYPDLPIVVVSAVDDILLISKVMRFGARGFIPKTSKVEDIVDAIDTIIKGQIWLPKEISKQTALLDKEFTELVDKVAELTPAQYNVLCCMRGGLLNKQIGYQLNIAEATVKAHVTATFKKLGINNRTQAVMIASKLNLEMPPLKA